MREPDEEEDDSQKPVDFQLYSKFWRLQDFFHSPNQCYGTSEWEVYIKNSEEVLNCFEGYKLSALGLQKPKKLPNNKKDENMEVDAEEQQQQYFAKYLSNRKLLDLQLSDSNFRRYILLQFLILHQYLITAVKFKADSQVLAEEQRSWLDKTNTRVYKLVEETPPDGKKFAESIKHILKREEYWNSWKNDGCPAFVKPPVAEKTDTADCRPPPPKKQKRSLGEAVSHAQTLKKFTLGTPELSKLWNLYPDNLEACKGQERENIPSLQDYFRDAIEEADPKNGIEPQHKKVNDMKYSWRALRLLAKRSPLFFELRSQFYERTSDYVENIVTKLSKDFPKEDDNSEVAVEEDDELEAASDSPPAAKPVTKEQISLLAAALNEDWKKLAPKLGFGPEKVEQFVSFSDDVVEQGENMLQAWMEQEKEYAVPDEIKYNLHGLKLENIAEAVFGEG